MITLTADLNSFFVGWPNNLREIAETWIDLGQLPGVSVKCEKSFSSQWIIVNALEFFVHVIRIHLDCTRNAMLLSVDQSNKMLLRNTVESLHLC